MGGGVVGWSVGETGNKANSAGWSWTLAELGKNLIQNERKNEFRLVGPGLTT